MNQFSSVKKHFEVLLKPDKMLVLFSLYLHYIQSYALEKKLIKSSCSPKSLGLVKPNIKNIKQQPYRA